MAAIKSFTEAQNASLAQVEVGNLILIDQAIADFDEENDSSSDGDNESDGGSDEDDGDEESSDEEDSSSESESESGAVTPSAVGVQDNRAAIVDTEHAEHIEDVSLVNSASAVTYKYRTLKTIQKGDNDDTEQHPITVYLVVKVAKNAKGAVEDLSLVPLKYSSKADASPDTFQLYGQQCVPSFYTGGKANQSSQSGKEFIGIRDLPGGETLKFTVSPQGDHVRKVVLGGGCPACDHGWLDCITQLAGMVKDYTITSSLQNEPAVCPSCIGIDLMKEHQDLRAELEAFSRVADFGAIHTFHGRLTVRRSELRYELEQFDERKWGMLFDDMLSDDNEDGGHHGGDNSRYEVWDEADDPSYGAILHPASDATIKSLPIKKYREVKTEDDAHCVVCREEFKDEQSIMQLPCKHFFCQDGCTVQWLKMHDTCPVCRASVSPVEENGGKNGTQEDVNDVNTNADAEQKQTDAAPENIVSTDRDDDVTMVDAW